MLANEEHAVVDHTSHLNGATAAFVSIRGVRLELSSLLNEAMLDAAGIAALRQQFIEAQPFPHLVIEGLFNPKLLELIHAEFDHIDRSQWRIVRDDRQNHNRLKDGTRWGPASELYFNLVNSGPFVNVLAAITGVDALLGDPYLAGGGLQETKAGGNFAMHTDFNKHVRTRPDNEMVMITYVNKDWNPAFKGALELWDIETRECVQSILPTFGRTVILKHSARSLHGHPRSRPRPDAHAVRWRAISTPIDVRMIFRSNGTRRSSCPLKTSAGRAG